ncbi:BCL2 modifying factor 2 [Syngnathus acus]|uniref:BCL2 modifying factor 2 n=1 Tax=Syngnathus acus TaxID=161584 RepID=UPI001885B1E3|nr:BCL2 modifying factor 2 [Syngnathus acus]
MDDEEEDTLRGTRFRDLKYDERAARMQSRQRPVSLALPLAPGGHDNNNGIGALACGLHRGAFHGNAALRWRFPVELEDRGARPAAAATEPERRRRRRRDEDDRMAERPGQREAALSVERQIGQKLREIGDKFQQDHIDVFLRQQRQNLPAWMRLTMAVFGFLVFPRPAAAPPHLVPREH